MIISNGYAPHLLRRPVFPHILGPELMNFVVQVFPQDRPERLHDSLHLAKLQVFLATLHIFKVCLKLVQSFVDLFVLCEKLELLFEGGHLPRQDRKNMLFLDCVMNGQMVDKVVASRKESADAHALRPFAGFASTIEQIPCLTEVLVLRDNSHVSRRGSGMVMATTVCVQTCPCAPPSCCMP